MELLNHPKTQERIMGMMQTGKPVRNLIHRGIDNDYSMELQDAYIVAATRSPIGKSGRGFFRNTRPDDLLVGVLKSALAQVPNLDPKLIEDASLAAPSQKAHWFELLHV